MLARLVNRSRQPRLPANPKTIHELGVVAQEYTVTSTGEQFFLSDNVNEIEEDEVRVIILATKANLRFLGTSNTWHVDGTFHISPAIFTQLFTVHGLVQADPQ